MKRKTICIFVCMLVFFLAVSSTKSTPYFESQKSSEIGRFEGYFIIGFMELIDPEASIREFEIVSFAILQGNGATIRLNPGEMIAIHGSIFAIEYNTFFIGLIGDYSIIG